MESMRVKLTGVAPLLQHNGRLADALDPATKAMKAASKAGGKGTDDGQEAIARAEFLGSLYWAGDAPFVPGVALERALRDASSGVERGAKKKFDAGVQVLDDAVLVYPGKQFKTPEALYESGNFTFRTSARVMAARVMRTRPKFDQWSAVFKVDYNPSLVNRDMLIATLTYAGNACGLGDWRPRFGRFSVEVLK